MRRAVRLSKRFPEIRDSEKIEITGAGTEFAPQQPPTKKGSHGDSAGGIDKVETPLPGLTDPADQGPGADQAGGIYNSGKEAVDLTAGHIVVSGIFVRCSPRMPSANIPTK